METTEKNNSTNDDINHEAVLTDLPVADAEADATKGATRGSGGDVVFMTDYTNASQNTF